MLPIYLFLPRKGNFDQHIHDYIENMATQRGVELDTLEGFRSMMLRSVAAMSQEKERFG